MQIYILKTQSYQAHKRTTTQVAPCRRSSSTALDIQSPLEGFASGFLVLVEGMGVDIQRGRGLAVAQETGYGRHVNATRNQQTCVAVSQ